MKKNILIFGAGSIGNHMTYASLKLGHNIFITDINSEALERMKKNIYPRRYGKWNNKINQINFKNLPDLKINFDLIIIGIPPQHHLETFNYCKKNLKFKKILIEKPLCVYNQKFLKYKILSPSVYCGYNHSISPSFMYFLKKLNKLKRNKISNIEIYWKEGWSGILKAHFWMKNEFDSYLGNIKNGGGALHEHSHGLHLMIIILINLKVDYKKLNFNKQVYYKVFKNKKYDYFDVFTAKFKNKIIKYETDLQTFPSKKQIRINCDDQTLIWSCNHKKDTDLVKIVEKNSEIEKNFKKQDLVSLKMKLIIY